MKVARLLLTVTLLSAPLTPAFYATPAVAQAPATPPPIPCPGNVNIVRFDDVKPGMMPRFLEAVAAQQAWYKKGGASDVIGVLRILDRDPATKTLTVSETQAMTTRVYSPDTKEPAHDADYAAFVAMFNESSTIKIAYLTCVVKM